MALTNITISIIIASLISPTIAEIIAAIKSIYIITSLIWEKKSCNNDFFFFPWSLFNPFFSNLDLASEEERPLIKLEDNSCIISSDSLLNHI